MNVESVKRNFGIFGGIKVIESQFVPRNKAIFIDEHTLTVKHAVYFYDHPKELFEIYDFDLAVKKYCAYVLDNLYQRIEDTFNTKFKEFLGDSYV